MRANVWLWILSLVPLHKKHYKPNSSYRIGGKILMNEQIDFNLSSLVIWHDILHRET